MNFCIFIFTLNSSTVTHLWLEAFAIQSFYKACCLAIDSSSNDDTPYLLKAAGFRLHTIPRHEFDHGATRHLAVKLCPDSDVDIFMTQDSILADSLSLQRLVAAFADPQVGVAYGRQLPADNATPIAAHARTFNYPPINSLKSSVDIQPLGIKTAFVSNSFAAYRRSALEDVGGFPDRCIVSEDTFVAAKMILAGWKVAYCADAQVYHSHNYTWRQEFQRYFDIGVFHAREPWVRREFGGAEGEGVRFLKSELKYLLREAPHLIPSALVRTVIKYLGFRAGLAERYLPVKLKSRLSMQKAFWLQESLWGDNAARAGEAG